MMTEDTYKDIKNYLYDEVSEVEAAYDMELYTNDSGNYYTLGAIYAMHPELQECIDSDEFDNEIEGYELVDLKEYVFDNYCDRAHIEEHIFETVEARPDEYLGVRWRFWNSHLNESLWIDTDLQCAIMKGVSCHIRPEVCDAINDIFCEC